MLWKSRKSKKKKKTINEKKMLGPWLKASPRTSLQGSHRVQTKDTSASLGWSPALVHSGDAGAW